MKDFFSIARFTSRFFLDSLGAVPVRLAFGATRFLWWGDRAV